MGAVACLLTGCSARPADNINDLNSVPRPPFPAFKADLEAVLNAPQSTPILDLQHQTFHFVVLFNTTRRNGTDFQYARNLIHGLLFHYLQRGDTLSVVPYRLNADLNDAMVEQTFGRENRNQLYEAIKPASGDEDGHDDENALVQTASKIEKSNRETLPQTIFIQVSDKEVSEPSKLTSQKLLSRQEFDKELNRLNLAVRLARSYSDNQSRIWAKVYTTGQLSPSSTLGFARDVPPPPWIFWTRFGGSVLAVLLIAFASYRVWLTRPQKLYIGPLFKKVRYGQPLVISGPRTGEGRVELEFLPTGLDVAHIEVTPKREVVLIGLNQFQISDAAARDNTLKLDASRKEVALLERGSESASHTIVVQLAKR